MTRVLYEVDVLTMTNDSAIADVYFNGTQYNDARCTNGEVYETYDSVKRIWNNET